MREPWSAFLALDGVFPYYVFFLMVLSQIGVLHGHHGPVAHLNRPKSIPLFGRTRLGLIKCGLLLVCFRGLSEIDLAQLRFHVRNRGFRQANLLSGGT